MAAFCLSRISRATEARSPCQGFEIVYTSLRELPRPGEVASVSLPTDFFRQNSDSMQATYVAIQIHTAPAVSLLPYNSADVGVT